MTKKELIDEMVAVSNGQLSKKQAEIAIKAFVEAIKKAFRDGATKISILGFGTLLSRFRKPRKARSPQTGEIISVAGTNVIAFRPGSDLKKAANGK